MKKSVRRILAILLCFLLVQPVTASAGSCSATFWIEKTKTADGETAESAMLYLRNFKSKADHYKMLFFSGVKTEVGKIWVCVNPEAGLWSSQQMSKYMEQGGAKIEDVVRAEELAIKVFGITKEGDNQALFELTKSRKEFSSPEYEVILKRRTDDVEDEPLETDASSVDLVFAEGESLKNIDSDVYLLIEEDHTLLPLILVKELYGIISDVRENSLSLSNINGVFTKKPTLFICSERNDTGIVLEECDIRLGNAETSSTELETTGETEMLTESATETEAVGETEAVTESVTETEAVGETEFVTETEVVGETEAVTETEAAGGTEAVTESETADQVETQAMTEAETEAVTVNETEAVTELLEETKTDTKKGFGSAGFPMIILAVSIVMLIGAVVLLVLALKKSGKKRNPFEDIDSEATLDPRKVQMPEKNGYKAKGTGLHKNIRIQAAVVNNKGRVRSNNEDNFYLNGVLMQREKMDNGALLLKEFKDPIQLYAVCDGMGGADSGEDASFCAVSDLADRKEEHEKLIDQNELKKVLRKISDKVYEEAAQRGQKSGTTIAMMLVCGGQAVFANVGDSRIYRFRDQKLSQISLDHSKVQRMISMGVLTPEQARKDPSRHVITQYLGMSPDVRVSPYIVTEEMLEKNDIYLLCSDGLTDMVEDSQLEEILKENKKLQDTAKTLFEAAMKNGGRDNTTVMLVHVLNN